MCFSTPKTYRHNKLSTETHYLGTYSVHPYPMEPMSSGSLTLKHPIALKSFPTHVATRKTYRHNELGMKMHYLAICCFHPYPTPGGVMNFETTHSNAFYSFETISNVFLDPENLCMTGISLKKALFGHFPCVQKFYYESAHVSDDMCIFTGNRK